MGLRPELVYTAGPGARAGVPSEDPARPAHHPHCTLGDTCIEHPGFTAETSFHSTCSHLLSR